MKCYAFITEAYEDAKLGAEGVINKYGIGVDGYLTNVEGKEADT